MIASKVFRDQPTLTGDHVRLEPLTLAAVEDYLAALRDPEVNRLTGTHQAFDRPKIEEWLTSRQDHDDRADWPLSGSRTVHFWGKRCSMSSTRSTSRRTTGCGLPDRTSSAKDAARRSPDALRWDDRWHDELLMSILRTDLRRGS